VIENNSIKINSVVFIANRSYALTSSRFLLIKHFLASGWQVVVASASQDEYADQLTEAGVIVETVSFHRGGLAPLADLKALFRLIQIYNKYRPSLIHHFQAKPIILGIFAAYFSKSAKIVNAITGLGHPFVHGGLTYYLAVLGYNIALHFSDATIYQNPDDRNLFIDSGWIDHNKAKLIVSAGVDTETFFPASTPPRNPLRVLMGARLLWPKGVREFVEAAEIVRQTHPTVRFCLAGEWDPVHPEAVDEAWLEAAVDKGIVEFLGYCRDMVKQFQMSSLVVLPSYREGVPRVLLESTACGVPVVTTDVPGCRETVIEGMTGLLVPPKDSEALANAISELLENPDLRKSMGRRGRQMVEEKFDIRSITEQYLDVYRELGIDI
jgi:glycosyltransferase involved in cell wall biosynthesis